jgi:hypothetical protein
MFVEAVKLQKLWNCVDKYPFCLFLLTTVGEMQNSWRLSVAELVEAVAELVEAVAELVEASVAGYELTGLTMAE